jgi:Na+:H+ antiporter, NhaA family
MRAVCKLAAAFQRRVRRALRNRQGVSSGMLLMATALALIVANSPWSEPYLRLLHGPFGVTLGPYSFYRNLEWWVNDVLMVFFFFAVGLEIRCEVEHGVLSSWRRAILPAAAALGGMLVPAGLYLAVAGAPSTQRGWGVPMATDIAFALGVLALLGKRVPPALRVLLLALAVIDDVGAIIVIALFYSAGVAWAGLALAALSVLAIVALQRLRVGSLFAYALPALLVWGGVSAAGVHPTIAGVLVGLLTPASPWPAINGGTQRRAPAESLLPTIQPWIELGIMPAFALTNAGVVLGSGGLEGAAWTVTRGVAAGLIVGKPLGVLLATALMLRLGIGAVPAGIKARHLVLLGIVAGVGFTMALFMAQLAFRDGQLLAAAKRGVLGASGVAALLALLVGRLALTAPAAVAESV